MFFFFKQKTAYEVRISDGSSDVCSSDPPRVTVLEQTSARILTPAMIDRPGDWVVCDASFIGLAKVLERPLELAAPRCRLVALIKPQFEVGREEVGKGGVVRDPALHVRVCNEARGWLERSDWRVEGIVESPNKGTEGKVEILVRDRRSTRQKSRH